MKKILFVDDEVNILNGLRRMLNSKKKEWSMHFVSSGQSALEFLSTQKVDIIVSDMRMPGMDGATLLGLVREKYPSITRIALSGYSDIEMISESVKVTHLFIAKPTDFETITLILERSFYILDIISDPILCEFISGISSVPCVPMIYQELVRELSKEDASIENVGFIVAKDIGISAKLLQIVNSSFFGFAREILSPQEAAAHLGLDIIQNLVLSIKIFEQFEGDIDKSLFDKIWRRSQLVSSTAKVIAKAEGFSNKEIDQVFAAGILQDIGKLIILKYHSQNIAGFLSPWEDINGGPSQYLEQSTFGVSHDRISAYLLNLWGIPHPVITCVIHHHHSAHFKNSELSLAFVLFVTNVIVEDQLNNNSLSDMLIAEGFIDQDKLDSWLSLSRGK